MQLVYCELSGNYSLILLLYRSLWSGLQTFFLLKIHLMAPQLLLYKILLTWMSHLIIGYLQLIITNISPKKHILVLILIYVIFVVNTYRYFLLRHYLMYVRPLLEYNSSVWSPHTSIDISILESVQKYFTKRLLGMESTTYDERLVALKLPSLSCLRSPPDLILLYKIMHSLIGTDLSKLFQLHSPVSISNIVTRGHSLKLYEPKLRINILKFFFSAASLNY